MDNVRIIVCGGREFNDKTMFEENMDEVMKEYPNAEIVSGHASGADTFGEEYAKAHGLRLSVFPAEWKKYGRAAGPIRNKQMLDYASEGCPVIVAFWNGQSRGTKNMVTQAKNAGAKCHVVLYQ